MRQSKQMCNESMKGESKRKIATAARKVAGGKTRVLADVIIALIRTCPCHDSGASRVG